MRISVSLLTLSALAIACGCPSKAWAATEVRCTELGAHCACAEPMNTQTYTLVPGTNWAWNPSDSTTKECNTSGAAGGFVEINNFQLTGTNSGEAIANLPAGHTNTFVLRTPEGQGGQFAGVKFNAGQPTALRAIRFYLYYSSNFDFTNQNNGACLNSSKFAQMGFNGAGTGGPLLYNEAGRWSFYDVETSLHWNMDTVTSDNPGGCCVGPGPGHNAPNPTEGQSRGKWWRIEFLMHNTAPTGPGTTFQAFVKNVTDNTPEIKVIDSSIAQNDPPSNTWDNNHATALHPTSEITDMSINMFRNGNCRGFAAYSHFLAAAWSTDAGQRIGPACEVEGGCGSGTDVQGPERPRALRLR